MADWPPSDVLPADARRAKNRPMITAQRPAGLFRRPSTNPLAKGPKERRVKHGTGDLSSQKPVFLRIALATGLILLVPLVAMQFTAEVNWNWKDFTAAAVLLFTTGSLFVLIARRLPRRRRLVAGAVFAAALLYIWGELAVGVFTTLGS